MDEDAENTREALMRRERQSRLGRQDIVESQQDRGLSGAMESAREWIIGQVIFGSNLGERNTNTIYTDVAQSIARPSDFQESVSSQVITMSTRLSEISERSKAFSRFGLTSPFDAGKLLSALVDSGEDKQKIILSVLKPFVDGLEARLDALQEVHYVTDTLIDNINSFFTDKIVSFRLNEGFKIQLDGAQTIEPKDLSSGEKQLLVLLCNTISARSTRSVFIIDEPELSLNIKWQRKLVPALLSCIKGSQVQYILASHSIEVLAKQRQYVQRLRDSTTK